MKIFLNFKLNSSIPSNKLWPGMCTLPDRLVPLLNIPTSQSFVIQPAQLKIHRREVGGFDTNEKIGPDFGKVLTVHFDYLVKRIEGNLMILKNYRIWKELHLKLKRSIWCKNYREFQKFNRKNWKINFFQSHFFCILLKFVFINF